MPEIAHTGQSLTTSATLSTVILTPSRDGRYCSGFVNGLATTLGHPAFTTWMHLEHESDIARARGKLASLALERTNARGFLFIDDDMEWTRAEFGAVINAAALGCAIVGGLYVKRRAEGGEVWNGATGERHPRAPMIEQVREIGTGFLWVDRAVFEIMTGYVSRCRGEKGQWWHFFRNGVHDVDGEYLSEDYAFCRLAQKVGFKVWLHRGIRLGHVGAMTFRALNAEAERQTL